MSEPGPASRATASARAQSHSRTPPWPEQVPDLCLEWLSVPSLQTAVAPELFESGRSTCWPSEFVYEPAYEPPLDASDEPDEPDADELDPDAPYVEEPYIEAPDVEESEVDEPYVEEL